jgi:hypothetical protein
MDDNLAREAETIAQILALLERVAARGADASPKVRTALVKAAWTALVALAPDLASANRVTLLEAPFAPGGVGGPTSLRVTERFLPVIERLAELGIVDPGWTIQVVEETAA